ncbi:MAG: hypothetical protein IJ302_07855 [Clostridia bacterium]|nr:hypothetical protein [Clostridia bacterium]
MNKLRSYLNTHRTALCCVLLVVLLLGTVCAAFCVTYPGHIRATLAALDAQTPASVPDAAVYTLQGDGALDTADTLGALSALGAVHSVTVCISDDADGTRLLLAAPADGLQETPGLFTLTDGRMPQNESECVVVLQDEAARALYEIGAAVRPVDGAGADGHCVLTVVGIGTNTLDTLAPLSESAWQVLVFTPSASLWGGFADAASVLLLTDGAEGTVTAEAIRKIEDETASARNAVLQANAQDALLQLTSAAQEADNALTAQQIALQEITNRYETVLLRVAEAEANLLAANDALQKEQQEFVSDMEVNEYYAVRQVDLIPRRTLAEEGYAKKQAEIDLITASLHAAYADRNTVSAELAAAEVRLASLTAAAEAAHAALDAAEAAGTNGAAPWQIRLRSEETAHLTMTASAHMARRSGILPSAAVLLLTWGAVFGICFFGRYTRSDVYRFTFMALPAVLLGILLGAYILPTFCFRTQFPALTAVTLQLFDGGSAVACVGLFVLLVLLTAGAAAAGAAVVSGKHN